VQEIDRISFGIDFFGLLRLMSKFAQIYSKKVDFDEIVSTGKRIQMKNLLEIFYQMNEPNVEEQDATEKRKEISTGRGSKDLKGQEVLKSVLRKSTVNVSDIKKVTYAYAVLTFKVHLTHK